MTGQLRPRALRLFAAVLTGAVAVMAAPAAQSETLPGPYMQVIGLYVAPSTSGYSGKFYDTRYDADLKTDSGFGLLAAVGYGADTGLRGEIEIGYRKIDFDKLTKVSPNEFEVPGLGTLRGDRLDPYEGDIATLSLVGNGIFAFEAGRLRPYIGLGLGVARHDSTAAAQTPSVELVGAGRIRLPLTRSSESDWVLAYQAMAGVAFALSDSVEARIGYRYFATGNGVRDEHEYSYGTHSFESGLRVRF